MTKLKLAKQNNAVQRTTYMKHKFYVLLGGNKKTKVYLLHSGQIIFILQVSGRGGEAITHSHQSIMVYRPHSNNRSP